MRFRKCSHKTTLLVSLIELFSMALVFGLSTHSISMISRNNAIKKMEVVAMDRSFIISGYVEEYEHFLDEFALISEVSECASNPDDAELRKKAQEYTDRFAERRGNLEGLYISEWDTYVLTHINPNSLNKTFREGDSLKQLQDELLKHEDAYCNGIVTAPVTKQNIIPIYKALYDEKNIPVGFIGAAFYTDEIAKTLEGIKKENTEDWQYFLINCKTGEYIFCSERDYIGEKTTIAAFENMINTVEANSRSTYTELIREGIPYIASAYYMDDYDWLFICADTAENVYRDSNEVKYSLLFVCAVAIIIIIIMAVLSYLGVNQLMKPLTVIGERIKKIEKNDYCESSEMKRYCERLDEYGMIANAIERLKRSVQSRTELYTQLLKIQSVGVIAVECDTEEILIINNAALKLFGISAEDNYEGKPDRLLKKIGENNAKGLLEILTRLKENDAEDVYEYEIEHPDNKVSYALSHGKGVNISDGSRINMITLTDITEKKLAEQKLQVLSETDGLTGISNRRGGEQRIEDALSSRPNGMFIIMDANKFKYVNDTFGHEAGDDVLKGIAKTLEESFRTTDILVRLGGDEFVVFALNVDSTYKAEICINRFFANLEKLDIPSCKDYRITMSMGVVLRQPEDDFNSLYKKADSLMYQSKARGGNAYEFYKAEE